LPTFLGDARGDQWQDSLAAFEIAQLFDFPSKPLVSLCRRSFRGKQLQSADSVLRMLRLPNLGVSTFAQKLKNPPAIKFVADIHTTRLAARRAEYGSARTARPPLRFDRTSRRSP
jgi:hypothetical protein